MSAAAAVRTPTARRRHRIAVAAITIIAVGAVGSAQPAGATTALSGRLGREALLADPDPGALGPQAFDEQEYNLGDQAFAPDGFTALVELKAKVYAPTTITGRAPIVVIQHGRHVTCGTDEVATALWPCPPALPEIPSYRGYDALGRLLASHGIIAVSIGANGINANDFASRDGGASARGQLIIEHLRRWEQWDGAATGPFGSRFVGKVDLDQVGLMGHSRGGEGVVTAAQLNQRLANHFGIRAVVALAPVDFARRLLGGVPLQVVLPYCDGDVSDLQGAAYYEDSRYATPGDLTTKQTTLVYGANHNFFNTVWTSGPGSFDDAGFFFEGPEPTEGADSCRAGQAGRLTGPQQAAAGATVMGGFLRRFVLDDDAFQPFVTGVSPFPASSGPARWAVAHHGGPRLDIARWADGSEARTNRLGRPSGVRAASSGLVCDPGSTGFGTLPDLPVPECPQVWIALANPTTVLDVGWVRPTAVVRSDLSATGLDVTSYDGLRFRVAFPPDGRNDRRGRQDFSVRLTDATGAQAKVAVGSRTNAVVRRPVSPVQHSVLNGVRLPLASFAGVDLTRLTAVELIFDRTASGRALVSDLAFTAEGTGTSVGPTQGSPDTAPVTGDCRRGDARRWACAVGQIVWGREAGSGPELEDLAGAFDSPVDRREHIEAVLHGPSAARPVVDRALQVLTEEFYGGLFLEGGDGSWEGFLRGLPYFHGSSPEAQTTATVVDAIYLTLVGRLPDAAGRTFWTDLSDEQGHFGRLVDVLLASTERARRVVTDRYRQILGRAPDTAGSDFWVQALRQNGGEQRMVSAMLRSSEFIAIAVR